MLSSIPKIRKLLVGEEKLVRYKPMERDFFDFLGKNKEEKVLNLAKRVASTTFYSDEFFKKRKQIFEYIVDFWSHSLIYFDYMKETGRGPNLARRPFLAPCAVSDEEDLDFNEQYRWDTFFQNLGLALVGGFKLAINQLLNIADVFNEYKRVPNALTTSYLSHSQPPLEIFSVFDLLNYGALKGEWTKKIISMVEKELFIEWWDYQSGKKHLRQNEELIERYGLLTRYTPIHHHPLLASCEDGKDHNLVSATFGSNYLPVQLNAIIYGILTYLIKYYQDENLGNDKEKVGIYQSFKERLYHDFQKVFWCEKTGWEGFRNYLILKGEEGPILYGDLAAEIWPLFVGLATKKQALITKENLKKYYAGDYGLAATSLILRKRSDIFKKLEDSWQFQWEYPNCWPPLMYIAVEGLKNYGYFREALIYQKNWVNFVEKEFFTSGIFFEKYVYSKNMVSEPGYYGTMEGFGWTVGVYLRFLNNLVKENFLD